MAINKSITIPLETTAKYQPLSDLNVRFWNQDKNTAELRFLITRNNFPLSLGKEHVNVIIALESGESFISSDEFEIDSEVEGVARFNIPTDFMLAATEVIGQIYVGTTDGDEVIVERQFSFEVSNDLLSNIPSEEKIRYIKTFDDLKVEIGSRLGSVEETLNNLENFIEEIENTTQQGVTEITNLFNAKTITFNENYDEKYSNIINSTTAITDFINESKQDMDDKKADFDEAVAGSGLVTEASTANWQKYKLTKDDGTRTYLAKGSFPDVHALEPGFYETITADTPTQGFPTGIPNAAFVEIDITKSGSERKQLKVVQSSNSKTFVKYIHTSGADNGWKQVAIVEDLALLETVSGSQSKANTAENNAKIYTDSKVDEAHKVLFSGSVNGINKTVNLTENMNNYEFIIVSGDVSGNDFSQIIVPSIVGTVVNMQNLNLRDSDGLLLGVYEVRLELTNTTIKITNDVAYDNPSGTGSGPARNAWSILRVEGVMRK